MCFPEFLRRGNPELHFSRKLHFPEHIYTENIIFRDKFFSKMQQILRARETATTAQATTLSGHVFTDSVKKFCSRLLVANF